MERQMAVQLSKIRRDHIIRYEFARDWLVKNHRCQKVLDAGAGTGYGSYILAQSAQRVIAVEKSKDAYSVFKEHYHRGNIDYITSDLSTFTGNDYLAERFDAVVCFEFIEHIPEEEARQLIKQFAKISDILIFSTPNELVRPHKKPPVNPYHFKHYTPMEMEGILGEAGLEILEWYSQRSGKRFKLESGTNGKFIIGVASSVQALAS
jgi:2-polyprenyl-3-methyl-5-hydroxy-6-metoxy-1,4-benzoquinol methylase